MESPKKALFKTTLPLIIFGPNLLALNVLCVFKGRWVSGLRPFASYLDRGDLGMTSIISHNSDSKHQGKNIFQRIYGQLNFYRIHLLFFTFTPLIISGIFYASNGRYKISYVDSLFNCVSAMTVCGLATINLSSLTGFQQALLFVLMCVGNPVIVSWFIVYMRRYFFAKKFENVLEAAASKKVSKIIQNARKQHRPWPHRFIAFVSGRNLSVEDEEEVVDEAKKGDIGAIRKLRPDMIRRMDDAPKLVNPSGWVSEGRAPPTRKASISSTRIRRKSSIVDAFSNPTRSASDGNDAQNTEVVIDFVETTRRPRRLSDPGRPSRPNSPSSASGGAKMHRFETVADVAPSPSGSPKRFPRTQTVEFAPPPRRPGRMGNPIPEHGTLHEEPRGGFLSPEGGSGRAFYSAPSMPLSFHTHPTHHSYPNMRPETSLTRGFGGFPSIFSILKAIIKRLFPSVERTLTRTVTIPATVSLAPGHGGPQTSEKKNVPYISFEAVVGRNSAFHLLTKDQLDEIGGVEYRALNALLWILPLYHFGIQLTAFTVIAPYMYAHRWDAIFQEQIRPLNRVWFSAFQVVSAYTNTGTSLVDQSMLPFQSAYPMIVFMIILILAGNTAFPVFLRFMIWCISKLTSKASRMHETLHFLLDHPRRCFIYLFPSHQTWFLLTVVLGLTFIDWFFFLVLDINNPAIQAIPVGIRVLDGFLQATAVRAAGFGIIPLAAVAPAVKVLYVVMMYISVYPIAMSVRSTNVYEEQSLGVFHPHDNELDLEDEQTFETEGPRMKVWSRYLSMHARKQLAFDMWWLALSLFLICIIEKNNLMDPLKFGWFTIFQIIFELVSAYGTVGLSLGIPYENYSFVGAMHSLSKLIICLVMIRGRHRGLPVAIDRAVMLPSEFDKKDEDTAEQGEGGGGQPFVYSETLGSRYTSDLRQRARRTSRILNESQDYGYSGAGLGSGSKDGQSHDRNGDGTDKVD